MPETAEGGPRLILGLADTLRAALGKQLALLGLSLDRLAEALEVSPAALMEPLDKAK